MRIKKNGFSFPCGLAALIVVMLLTACVMVIVLTSKGTIQ